MGQELAFSRETKAGRGLNKGPRCFSFDLDIETEGFPISVMPAKRDRVFCAQEILSILEEPPRLEPE